jgi:hypothetical protein
MRYAIQSKDTGKYLSFKYGIFGNREDARTFKTADDATSLLNDCVKPKHRNAYEVVGLMFGWPSNEPE